MRGQIQTIDNMIGELRPVIRKDVMLQALPNMVFNNFVTPEDDLTKEPGNTIRIYEVSDYEMGDRFLANDLSDIPLQTTQDFYIDITVYECGLGTAITAFAQKASLMKQIDVATKLLARDYQMFLDGYIRDTFLNAPNVLFEGGAVDDTGLSTANTLSVTSLKDAVEVLRTFNAAPFNRPGIPESYVVIAHPHVARSLTDQAQWEKPVAYNAADRIWKGEVGHYFETVLIQTTQMQPNGIGANGQPIYPTLVIAQDAVGLATALPMDIRNGALSWDDRKYAIGWYSILGAGIIRNSSVVQLRSS